MPDAGHQGTVLAFDFGEKRIGVAVGEWTLRQAHPLLVIHGEANADRFAAIAALISEWQPTSLVVGLPVSLDGAAHAMTARATRFANQLRGRFSLPVAYADERLSSVEAEERLRESGSHAKSSGKNAKSHKAHLDALAAQIILEGYFEQASAGVSPENLSPSTELPANAPP
jgi:putative holliday junction resolvase